MKIAFVSNFINHYQVPISDEFYRLTNGNYFFIETQELPESFKKGGFSEYEKPYIIRAWKNEETRRKALSICKDADVLIAGGGRFVIPYEKERLKNNKLTFEYAERSLKRGLINLFSPTNLIMQAYYHLFFYNKPFYKLCVSAFTANDMYLQHAFKGRCYKFGYFPTIAPLSQDESIDKRDNKHIKIIWCARFIKWKHPELAVILGNMLREANYDFEINMIGNGVLFDNIKEQIDRNNLSDCVHLLGNFPNSDVLKIMRKHDIFLFTSDQNEGWGVVLNEAMGQYCCPVASNMIGAAPFLIRHGENGMMFKSEDIQSLYDAITYLLDNPTKMKKMAREAYDSISTVWTPQMAAERFYAICESILKGTQVKYENGPMSPALPTIVQ